LIRKQKTMKLIGPFSQIITLNNIPLKGKIVDNQLEIIVNGGLIVENSTIKEVGKFHELLKKYPKTEVEEIETAQVLIPNFIDCHTHICYEGSRANDFSMRNSGLSYLEIAKQGGGIWNTVNDTRNATLEKLTENTLKKIHSHIKNGISTIEIKSGYGLDKTNEIKILQAIDKASKKTKATLIPTCLSAHIKPKDFNGNTKEYLDYCLLEIIPNIKNYSNRIDIFIEETAFGIEESNYYLYEVKKLGFDICVHADQFTTGGSKVAIENGALSADHLEASSEMEIKLFSKTDTVAVALPGASLGLGEKFAPARKLLDSNAILAIASDWNPGSAPQGDLLAQASILACYEKLSNAEVFAALTFRAAKALKLFDRGKIVTTFKPDFHSYLIKNYQEIIYNQGKLKPETVWIDGEKIDFNKLL